MEIISGNNQSGSQGQQLDEPIKVKVSDNIGNALSNVPVYFETQGGGIVENNVIITNSEGIAETFWTLGNDLQNQSVDVSIRNAEGSNVENVHFVVNEVHSFQEGWYVGEYQLTNPTGGQSVCNNEDVGQIFPIVFYLKYTGDNFNIIGRYYTVWENFSQFNWYVTPESDFLDENSVNYLSFSVYEVDVSGDSGSFLGCFQMNESEFVSSGGSYYAINPIVLDGCGSYLFYYNTAVQPVTYIGEEPPENLTSEEQQYFYNWVGIDYNYGGVSTCN